MKINEKNQLVLEQNEKLSLSKRFSAKTMRVYYCLTLKDGEGKYHTVAYLDGCYDATKQDMLFALNPQKKEN